MFQLSNLNQRDLLFTLDIKINTFLHFSPHLIDLKIDAIALELLLQRLLSTGLSILRIRLTTFNFIPQGRWLTRKDAFIKLKYKLVLPWFLLTAELTWDIKSSE